MTYKVEPQDKKGRELFLQIIASAVTNEERNHKGKISSQRKGKFTGKSDKTRKSRNELTREERFHKRVMS